MDIKAAIKNLKIDLASIADENLRGCIILLMHAVEQFSKENDELRKTNQTLKNEIARLKGEQGTPSIRPQAKNTNHSSENDRKDDSDNKNNGGGNGGDSFGNPQKNPKPKKDEINIDRTVRCNIDPNTLPPDAVFKGLETVVTQDIKIVTDNVRFEREVYYSASENKTYLAALPSDYQGQFGSHLKSLVLNLYQDGRMTELAIHRFLQTHGTFISTGKISNIITKDVEPLHQEKKDIVDAGLASTDYQHLDDTGSRVNGKNYHTHILCNPFYTAFFTLPKRDRLAVLEVLSNGNLLFCINNDAYQLMTQMGLSDKRLIELKRLNIPSDLMTRDEIKTRTQSLFPNPHKNQTSQKIICEAAALIAYQQYALKTNTLMTDGALQFQMVTQYQILCWIHEGRHYKKLNPLLLHNRALLDAFLKSFWDFYRELRQFKKAPTAQKSVQLSAAFDTLFSQKTGYQDLDDRIAVTKTHKEKLLLVLQLTHLPLHNNPAELGARTQACKRDVSLQTKNAAGTKSKDTLMTITETAKKLGVNTYKYFHDRISRQYKMQSLADLIQQRSKSSQQLVPA